jgi:hypothetical protein
LFLDFGHLRAGAHLLNIHMLPVVPGSTEKTFARVNARAVPAGTSLASPRIMVKAIIVVIVVITRIQSRDYTMVIR